MKTITLNIGLTKNTGERLAPHKALSELNRVYSLHILRDTRVCASPNGDEQVLVITLEDDCSDCIIRNCVANLAYNLQQDCIAILWPDGTGELIGPKAAEWGEFRPEYFVGIDGETLAPYLREIKDCTIKELRNLGYSVIVWTPEEIKNSSPNEIQDVCITAGNEYLEWVLG